MEKRLRDLVIRYVIILVIGAPNLYLIYKIFTPLTLYPLYFLSSVFFDTSIVENVILIGNISLEIIPACVAGAAYFLLLLLNLTTPMDKNQRVKSLMFSIGGFYLVNIVRLFLFAILITKSVRIFDLTHMATWYFLSTVLVVVIWFAAVKIYKIKKIPIYEDIRFLFSKSLLNSRRKKQK